MKKLYFTGVLNFLFAFTAGFIFSMVPLSGQILGVDCVVPTEELVANATNDTKALILPAGTTASSWQPGEDITRSFDNNHGSLYHSSWSNTIFPVTLNYRLNGSTPIDYLKYIPRSDGGTNGNFGLVEFSYNTLSDANMVPLMSYDFDQSGVPTVVTFPASITPLNLKMVVYDGAGGFASCAEMEFYTRGEVGTSESPYAAIFSDSLYSEIHPSVTQENIDTIASDFYKSLAQCLFDQTYNKQYRVQNYEVYKSIQALAMELKTSTYDAFENATGIAFKKGRKIALFAQDIPQNIAISLRIRDFALDNEATESSYPLQNGLNVFELTSGGLGYVSYYSNDVSLPTIRLNIVSGEVNGFFKSATATNEDWKELLEGPAYPKIDLLGQFVHLVYDKDALRTGNPTDGLALVDRYDEVIRYQRQLMGLFKYNRSPKNRQFAYSAHGGGWYAGGLGVHFDLDWGINNITSPDNLDLWGIAHEFGHINQIRPDLVWHGTTEVTTNIYSLWVTYKMNPQGNLFGRLESEARSPFTGAPSLSGGIINGAIYDTYVQEQALQGSLPYDVFKILVPFWQLELYYQDAGASKDAPLFTLDNTSTELNGVDYAKWFATVAEAARAQTQAGMSNGAYLLNFVKNVCNAVQEDLTDFFINTGFLRPIDVTIDDYGVDQVVITQNDVDEAIAFIKSMGYNQPVSPVIHYMSAHSVVAFRDKLPVSGDTGQGVTRSGQTLTILHDKWPNAVAFEVFDATGNLLHVMIAGTGNTSNQTTLVYYPDSSHAVYAVGFDGQKILVFPENSISSHSIKAPRETIMFPNPVKNTLYFDKVYKSVAITNHQGALVLFSENTDRVDMTHLPPAVYLVKLRGDAGSEIMQKVVKK